MFADENAEGVAGEEKLVFENPPNKGYIQEMVMGIGTTFAIGVVIVVWAGSWAFMAWCFAIGVMELFLAYRHEYLRRPTVVRIVGGGLELDFQNKKSVFIDWNDILALNAREDSRTKKKQSPLYGVLFLRKVFYFLKQNIAIAVRDAYQEQTGKVLPKFPSDRRRNENPPEQSK